MPKPSRNLRSTKFATRSDLFGIDLRSLAAFRIALALLVLADLGFRSQVLEAFYTDAGVLPRSLVDLPLQGFSLHLLSGAFAFQAVLCGLAGLFALLLLFGYQTRFAAVGSWLMLSSLHVRNLHVVNGGDDWLRAMLLWSILLPVGARWSLDARRVRPKLAGPVFLSLASAALLLQFAYVYLCAGFTKRGPEWHSTGTAIQAALAQGHWVRPFGEFLNRYPEWLRILTPTVAYFEIAAALLMFLPVFTGRLRGFLIVSFWLLQLGFGLSLQVHLFPWISTAATLPFIPSSFWDRLSKRAAWIAEPDLSSAAVRNPVRQRPREPAWAWWLQSALAIFLITWVLISALTFYVSLDSPGLRRVRSVGYIFGLLSTWHMYSAPSSQASTYEIIAKLKDGSIINLLSTADVGRSTSRTLRSHCGKMYLAEMAKRHTQPAERQQYLLWLSQQWNQGQPLDRQVQNIKFFDVKRNILTPGPPRRDLLLEGDFSRPDSP